MTLKSDSHSDQNQNQNHDSHHDSDSRESRDSDSHDSRDSEVRLTAYLLGELSAESARSVERELKQDRQLQCLAEHLEKTIQRIRQTTPLFEDQSKPEFASLRFSSDRRAALLQRLSKPFHREDCQEQKQAIALPLALAAILMLGLAYLAFLQIQIASPIKIAAALDENLRIIDSSSSSKSNRDELSTARRLAESQNEKSESLFAFRSARQDLDFQSDREIASQIQTEKEDLRFFNAPSAQPDERFRGRVRLLKSESKSPSSTIADSSKPSHLSRESASFSKNEFEIGKAAQLHAELGDDLAIAENLLAEPMSRFRSPQSSALFEELQENLPSLEQDLSRGILKKRLSENIGRRSFFENENRENENHQNENHELQLDAFGIFPNHSKVKKNRIALRGNFEAAFPLEMESSQKAISTFSLNVSDVSFRLAAAALEAGQVPERASIRPEEFFNALAYHDIPKSDSPISVLTERCTFPFGHHRELLRISLRTRSLGRDARQPLHLVVVLDNSGSMERPDRQAIVRRALRSLFENLESKDRISLITFARKPRLRAEALSPESALNGLNDFLKILPEGGTDLESALRAGYECARKHYQSNGQNRLLLLTDGAANLGNTNAQSLRQIVINHRKQGIALDCFGIGWEAYEDHRLEILTRNGDGRYAFLNDFAQVESEFLRHLTGALYVAAKNVKVQIRFNPDRVKRFRQIGYAKHQLKKEDFRDARIDAAEMASEEIGTALYILQVDSDGKGAMGEIAIRYQNPETEAFHERHWHLAYLGKATDFEDASPEIQLALAAALFAERLADIPYSRGISFESIDAILARVAPKRPLDPSLDRLMQMLLQAQRIGL